MLYAFIRSAFYVMVEIVRYKPVSDGSVGHLESVVQILFQPPDLLLYVLHLLLAASPGGDTTKLTQ